jgi:sarcosine oxidase
MVGDERVDVAVVGGGVIGLAAGWQLARRGRDVLVLEQFDVGHARGSSHGASRVFRLGYDDIDYVRMARASGPLWRELEDESGEHGLLTITGALAAGSGAASVHDALRAAAVECELLDEQEARRRHPDLVLAGPALWEPSAGVLAADRCLFAFQRALAAAGGRLREGAEVSGLKEDARGVTLVTAAGRVRASVVVLCCGAWAPELLSPAGVRFSFLPTREQIAYVAPAGGHLPDVPVFIEWGEPAHYGLPTPAFGWYKLAEHGTGAPVDPADPNRSLEADPAVGHRLAAVAARVLPGFGSEPVAQETCLYDNTPDRDFILDRRGRLVVGAGTSGHGFKFAPLLGAALASLALGSEPAVPRARFALGRAALLRADLLLERPR